MSTSGCCVFDSFEHTVGYVFYSLVGAVEECMAGVVCCLDDYALRVIDSHLRPGVEAVLFYAKLSGSYQSQRIHLVQIDNHYKHFLFDNWGAAKGTMNTTFYELEARSPDELEVNIALCRTEADGCRVASSVRSKLLWALRARPQAWDLIRGTRCEKALLQGVLEPR